MTNETNAQNAQNMTPPPEILTGLACGDDYTDALRLLAAAAGIIRTLADSIDSEELQSADTASHELQDVCMLDLAVRAITTASRTFAEVFETASEINMSKRLAALESGNGETQA